MKQVKKQGENLNFTTNLIFLVNDCTLDNGVAASMYIIYKQIQLDGGRQLCYDGEKERYYEKHSCFYHAIWCRQPDP